MALRFRLFYRGALPSAGKSRTDYKDELRAALHPQLKDVWDSEPMFRESLRAHGLSRWS
jgi:hypothetical protein